MAVGIGPWAVVFWSLIWRDNRIQRLVDKIEVTEKLRHEEDSDFSRATWLIPGRMSFSGGEAE